ncbi:hypothetical protein ACMFMG_004847 [Clarireedia jacksonii]
MKGGGLALKSLQWFLRIIEFCCAAIILGIFSYFLAALADHDLGIATYLKAVEGIAGAGVLYTIIGLLLLCCLAGFVFFSIIAILLDFAFTGAFIYVAYATRGGRSCSGFVNTPLGSGNANSNTRIDSGSKGFVGLPSLKTACKLNTACFAVAIIAAVFFFLSIFVEILLMKHHKKEKAFGPSPNNGYTAGTPRRKFWQRKSKRSPNDTEYLAGGEKPDALPVHTSPDAVRNSYATDATMVGHNADATHAYQKPSVPYNNAGTNGYTTGGYTATSPTHTTHTTMHTSGGGLQTVQVPANYRGTGAVSTNY